MIDKEGRRYVRVPVDLPAEVFLLLGEHEERLSLETGCVSDYIALLIKDDLTDERAAVIEELRAVDRELTAAQERMLELQRQRSVLASRFQDIVSRNNRSLERTVARLEEVKRDG
jgi:hypothetical protein